MTPLHAQIGSRGYDLSHNVAFAVGDTYFSGGDSITVDSVRGTSDSISSGNLYEVKGHYTLLSHDSADLAANITGSDKSNSSYHGLEVQHVAVEKGTGQFTLYMYMFYKGWPHLSFYPTGGGSSFAGIYFGTGDSVMKPRTQRGTDTTGAQGAAK